jgi:hypothetical protein
MSTARKILICGGGNGAHCLSTLAASRENLEVNVLTLSTIRVFGCKYGKIADRYCE